MNNKKTRNIVIQNLKKDERDLIDQVKEETKQKTATKAIFQACSEYLLYKRKYTDLEKRFFALIDKYTLADNQSQDFNLERYELTDEERETMEAIGKMTRTSTEISETLDLSGSATRARLKKMVENNMILRVKEEGKYKYKNII